MTQPAAHSHHQEGMTIALYLAIALLGLLTGWDGNGDALEALGLLWGTTIGLLLAHYFALRLARVFARTRPLPTAEDAREALVLGGAAAAVAGVASLPFVLSALLPDLDIGLTASGLLLVGVIGGTGFVSVRRAGGGSRRALAFAALAVLVAAAVVAIKYVLTH